MPKTHDLTGKEFSLLTVISQAENKNNITAWNCICSCSLQKSIIVTGDSLKRGYTKSCGCLKNARGSLGITVEQKIRNSYKKMKQRCYNPNTYVYEYWGGKGVTVCNEWLNDYKAFFNYVVTFEHCGEDGYTLDRFPNNSGNYEPNNVRWASKVEQVANSRPKIVKKIRESNKSGLTGVCYDKRDNRWRAELSYNGIKYCSSHKTKDEAIAARKEYERQAYNQ